MAAKKKTNPNKIPISPKDYEIEQIKLDATRGMGLQVWAAFLAALTSFSETTTDSLLDFFSTVNDSTTTIGNFDDTQEWLSKIEEFSGETLPLKRVNLDIKTKGDLDRFQNCLRRNAQAATFAIILEPTIREHILEEETLKIVIKKVINMIEEIDAGEISVQDIQEMLQDEYGLYLVQSENLDSLRLVKGSKEAS